MNNDLFQQARSAYVERTMKPRSQISPSVSRTPRLRSRPAKSVFYHQIGNCLVKLHDPNEAIHAQALHDSAYDALGSVAYNLGTVYASQLDYEDAIPFFAEALEDPKYKTGYKAYMGLGNAYANSVNQPKRAHRSALRRSTNPTAILPKRS